MKTNWLSPPEDIFKKVESPSREDGEWCEWSSRPTESGVYETKVTAKDFRDFPGYQMYNAEKGIWYSRANTYLEAVKQTQISRWAKEGVCIAWRSPK